MKSDRKKWYLIVALFISLCGIASVVPSQKNQFEEAINVFSQQQNINKEQLEIITASHQVLFLFHTVYLEAKVKNKDNSKIKAPLKKAPFGSYYISKLESW